MYRRRRKKSERSTSVAEFAKNSDATEYGSCSWKTLERRGLRPFSGLHETNSSMSEFLANSATWDFLRRRLYTPGLHSKTAKFAGVYVASALADRITSNSREARIALPGETKGIGSKPEFLLTLEFLRFHRLKPTLHLPKSF